MSEHFQKSETFKDIYHVLQKNTLRDSVKVFKGILLDNYEDNNIIAMKLNTYKSLQDSVKVWQVIQRVNYGNLFIEEIKNPLEAAKNINVIK